MLVGKVSPWSFYLKGTNCGQASNLLNSSWYWRKLLNLRGIFALGLDEKPLDTIGCNKLYTNPLNLRLSGQIKHTETTILNMEGLAG